MKRDIAVKSCVNKRPCYARIKFHRDFYLQFVFWEILNSELLYSGALLYFIHLLEILNFLDQRSAVSLTQ